MGCFMRHSYAELFLTGSREVFPPEDAFGGGAEETAPAGLIFDLQGDFSDRKGLRGFCDQWIQRYREKGLLPPILAVEYEGGQIHGLGDLATRFSLPGYLPDRRVAEVGRIALQQGMELHHLGFNFIIGPVYDVSPESQKERSHTILGRRTWGRFPLIVATRAEAARAGFSKTGIMACPRYFPGMGKARGPEPERAGKDALPVVEMTSDDWWHQDGLPYYAAIEAGAHALMVGNFIHQAYDPVHPIPLSARWLGALRRDLNYAGVVVSDDLAGLARTCGQPLAEVVGKAFRAGVDLIQLWPEGGDDSVEWGQLLSQLEKQAAEDALLRERMEQARERVRRLRSCLSPPPRQLDEAIFLEGRRLKAEVEH